MAVALRIDWKKELLGSKLASKLSKTTKTTTTAPAPAPKTTSTSKETPKESPKASAEVKKEAPKAAVKTKKKLFFMDVDYLLVALIFVIVLFSSKGFALELTAPQSVVIDDVTSFQVKISNDSSTPKEVALNVFVPAQVEVLAPRMIAANSDGFGKVTIHPTGKQESLIATIQLDSPSGVVEKQVDLEFTGKNSNAINASAFFALFSFDSAFNELLKFTTLDWIIFWALALVAAVLFVGFIARLNRRI